MNQSKDITGFAVALAWPETYCKQPGSWYDGITLALRINKNNYYKVGHAALLLISKQSKEVRYFDFGRYHTPYQHGRVRSVETDHDLAVKTLAELSSDERTLVNFKEILFELQNNSSCHGEGVLHASYCGINYESALLFVRQMQRKCPVPYGPFKMGGSNCSRFVQSGILAGGPKSKYRWLLQYKVPFTPTPISNVNALENKEEIPRQLEGEVFCPIKKLKKELLVATLPAPKRPPSIPSKAQWLSGEGAGSWFEYQLDGTIIKMTRYSTKGVVECTGLFENKDALNLLMEAKDVSIAYPSNCLSIVLKVGDKELQFERAYQ